MTYKQFRLIIALSLGMPHVYSQIYNFERYSLPEGLSQSQVFDIKQDTLGRVWLATERGGITILSGEHPIYLGKKDGLPGNSTYSIFYDHQHRMWLGTDKGVCFYNGKSLQRPIGCNLLDTLSVWDITQRTDQTIVFATNDGVYAYNDSVGCYLLIPELKGNPISRLAARTNNLLYIMAYQKPLLLFDGRRLETVLLTIPTNANIEFCFFDSKDQIYVGTTHGLVTREGYSDKTITTADGLSDDHILSIAEDRYGNIWIGTDEGGINVMMPDTLITITAGQGIGNNRINALYFDNYQNLWVGTDGAGAYVFKGFRFKKFNLPEFIETISITAIKTTPQNRIIVGTGGYGLLTISQKKRYLFNQTNGLKGNSVRSIEYLPNGEILVGTTQGISVIKHNRVDFQLTESYDVSDPISIIRAENPSKIWIGTSGQGVILIEQGKKHRFTQRMGLVSNTIHDIAINKERQVFFATDKGLSVLSENRFKSLSKETGFQSNTILSLCFDHNENLWMITDVGMIRIKKGQISNFALQSLSQSNILYSITNDKHGNLIVGTERGLMVIYLDRNSNIQRVKEYTREDGFLGMECNPIAVWTACNNEIYFGTKQGVTIFDPKADSLPNPMPNAYILRVELLYKKSDWRNYTDSILPWSLLPHNPQLPYTENNINFSFAANDFQFSSKLMFQYYLHGYDKTWLSPTKERTVNYTNLPPGNYEMRVRSFYPPDITSLTYSKFSFTILTPFYYTWLFIITAIAGALGVVVLVWNWRVYVIRSNERRLEAIVKERTADIERQKIELIEANIKISQSAKLKEQFLANTSHEIRTPLNVISGYTNLLLNTKLDTLQQKYLNYIKESSENLKVIVNDILDFSKIEADKLEIDSIPFDFVRTIRTTSNHLEIEAAKQSLNLELSFKNITHNVVEGDPVRLTQIISNLVRNAIKFTPKGSITINVINISDRNDHVVLKIEIIDTGIGIPANKIDTIFESFTQVSSDTTRKFGGTGLGLTIVKRLVDKHNGTITVESREGEGSKFTVILPYKVSTENPVETTINDYTISPHHLSKEVSILLVDDNEINVALAENTLKSFSSQFHIQTAYNGLQSIDLAGRNIYDLIIMDIQMPEMDGYTATEVIRQKLPEPNRSVPILGMTAHAMRDERDKCLRYGMNEYIAKPFSPRVLFETILALTNTSAIKISDQKNQEIEPMPGFGSLNPTQLWKNSGGKSDRFARYLQMYSQSVPKQISDLELCLSNQKEGDIRILAHTLKTSFKYLGIKEAANFAYDIEKAYTSGGYVDHKTCLTEIKRIWRDAENEISRYLNQKAK